MRLDATAGTLAMPEALARLLLRAESVTSSCIAGHLRTVQDWISGSSFNP